MKELKRVVLGAVLLGAAMCVRAQTSGGMGAGEGSHSCKVDNAPLSEADAADAKGDDKRALKLYREMVAKDPGSMVAQSGVILNDMRPDRLETVWADANKLVQGQVNNSIAQETLATLQMARGEESEAAKTLAKAIALDPCNATAIAAAATIEWMAGQGESASRHADLAHRLAPLKVRDIWARTRPSAQRADAYAEIAANLPTIAEEGKADALARAAEERLLSQSHCTVIPAREKIVVPLRLMDLSYGSTRDAVGIEVKINGHGERIELDKGGPGIVLTRMMAESLGLKNEGVLYDREAPNEFRFKTYFTHIPSLRVGDVEYRDCGAIVVDEDLQIREHSRISVGFFGDFLVSVDFARSEMTLDGLPPLPAAVRKEQPSINGGSWSTQEAYRLPEMKDWTHIYRTYSEIYVPTQIGPGQERLFRVALNLPHSSASEATAKEAIPLAQYPGLNKDVKRALGGAKYVIQFGGIVQPVNAWNVTGYTYYGGTLGAEALHQLRISIDFRDNLALFQRSK